jgi:TB2/DP1, HVA22 family
MAAIEAQLSSDSYICCCNHLRCTTVFELFEAVGDSFLSFIPFYWEGKLVFIIYLLFFGGASLCYRLLEPLVSKYENSIDDAIATLPSDAQKAASQVGSTKFMQDAASNSTAFIQKYGAEAFTTVMSAYTASAKQSSQHSKFR